MDACIQKAAVNGSMSEWRPVTSGVCQGSVLGQVFNIFVGDFDSGIECTLSQFAYDTKLCGVVLMLEGSDIIQRDLDCIERWILANIMKFNNYILHCLKRSITSRSSEVILPICSSLVRSHWEY